jgi:hypothetical protein
MRCGWFGVPSEIHNDYDNIVLAFLRAYCESGTVLITFTTLLQGFSALIFLTFWPDVSLWWGAILYLWGYSEHPWPVLTDTTSNISTFPTSSLVLTKCGGVEQNNLPLFHWEHLFYFLNNLRRLVYYTSISGEEIVTPCTKDLTMVSYRAHCM